MKIKNQEPIKCSNKIKKYYYIYCIYIKSKNWYYIGQRQLPNKYNRAKDDIIYLGSGTILCNYKAKYGISDLYKKILIEGWYTKNQINKLEIKYIAKYNKKYGNIRNKGLCINLAKGGNIIGINSYYKKSKKEIKISHLKGALKSKGQHFYNNGKVEKSFHDWDNIPSGFVKGRLPFSIKTRKKMSKKQKGKIISKHQRKLCSNYSKSCSWYNNGKIEKFVPESPGKIWKKGRLPLSKFKKEKMSKLHKKLKLRWWTNGKKDIFCKNKPGKKYKLGRSNLKIRRKK